MKQLKGELGEAKRQLGQSRADAKRAGAVLRQARKYNPARGAYSGIVPEPSVRALGRELRHRGVGAGSPYSTIDLNDGVFGTPCSVTGGNQNVYALGVNWCPDANMRFLFDFLHGDISKQFTAAAGGGIAGTPVGAPVGGSFDAAAMRMQLAF